MLRDADSAAPVPSCPDWTAADLLAHLTEVQWFWGEIVEHRRQSPPEEGAPPRPTSYADLIADFDRWSTRLQRALADADPAEPVWMWAEDRTVGYVRRRQAHEALIHRLDAELTTGQVTALDADLAADGVLEVLDVMFGGCPPWGTFATTGPAVRVEITDIGRRFPVVLGRFTGTDPESGTAYDETSLSVRDAAPETDAAAVLRGSADDLDAWLWHRRDDSRISLTGDPAVVAALRGVLDQPID